MTTFSIRALHTSVRVVAADEVGELLRHCLADLVAESVSEAEAAHRVEWSASAGGRWLLSLDGDGYLAADDHAGVVAETLIAINRWAAESVAGHAVPLHAGGFAVQGRGVAIVGRSTAGKSTLLAAAVGQGYDFIAEEVCAVGDDLFLQPYPRPIGLRSAGAGALGIEIPGGPHGLFGRVYPWRPPIARPIEPVALRLIAIVSRRPGSTELRPVREPDALRRLTDLTVGGGEPREMFRRLATLVRRVPVIDVCFEDVHDAARSLAGRATTD